MSKSNVSLPAGFATLLKDVKARIQKAQSRAVLSANAELVRLYWDIGRLIDTRQARQGWGAAVIPRLALELRNELPEIKGFSERNIKSMLAFYREYADPSSIVQQPVAQLAQRPFPPQAAAKLAVSKKVQQPVAQLPSSLLSLIPWGHHLVLLGRLKDLPDRIWYMRQTLANGWSRNLLVQMIESEAHRRQGKALSNFKRLLPPPQSDLVQQALKDPYIFDFLTLEEPFHEREYALRGMDKPIGISQYELTRALPASLKSALPTVEEIEAELAESARAPIEPPRAKKRKLQKTRKKRSSGSRSKKVRSR